MSKTANQILNDVSIGAKLIVEQCYKRAADGTSTAHPEQVAMDFAWSLVDQPEMPPAELIEKIHEAIGMELYEYTNLDIVAPYEWQRQDLATRYWGEFKEAATVAKEYSPEDIVDHAVSIVFERKTFDFVHEILDKLQ